MNHRRGQLLTTDFILSLAIFLAILLVTMSLWNSVDTQVKDSEERREMQAVATYVSDSLVRNTGLPANWTSENVQVIGLAMNEHILDLEKVLMLKSMDYEKAKSIMRLGNYDFRVWLTDGMGYNLTTGIARSPVAVIAHSRSKTDYLDILNQSEIVWDFYWDDSSSDRIESGYVNGLTKRYAYYSGNVIDSFKALMENQTEYRTIIIEDIGVNKTDLSGVNEKYMDMLINFTKRGGILIYTDTTQKTSPPNKPLVESIGMSFESPSLGTMEVYNVKPVLMNVSERDTVSFSSLVREAYRDQSRNDSELRIIANSSSGRCNICWWDYGFGRVYYVEDTKDDVVNSTGGRDALKRHLNIVGENLIIGPKTDKRTDLINIRRMAILSGFEREVINLNLIVWK